MTAIREYEKHEASMYELVNRVRDAVYQIHKLTNVEPTTEVGRGTQLHHLVNEYSAPIIELFPEYSIWIGSVVFLLLVDWGSKLEPKTNSYYRIVNASRHETIEDLPYDEIPLPKAVRDQLPNGRVSEYLKAEATIHYKDLTDEDIEAFVVRMQKVADMTLADQLKAGELNPVFTAAGPSFPRTFTDRVNALLNIADRKPPVLSLGNIEGAQRVRYTDTKGVVHESPLPHTLGYAMNEKEVQEAFERYNYQLDLKSPHFMRPLIHGRKHQPLLVGPGGHIDSDDASGFQGMFDREWPEEIRRPFTQPAQYTYPTHGDMTRGFIQLTGRRLFKNFSARELDEKILWYTGVHHPPFHHQQYLSARMGFDYPKVKITLDYKSGGLFLNKQLVHCWPEGQRHLKQAIMDLLPSKDQIQIAFFGALREPTVKPQFSKGKRLK